LLVPTTQCVAPPAGDGMIQLGGERIDVVSALIRNCATFSQSGHPALSLPALSQDGGAPVGLQLVGRRHHEAELLEITAALEDLLCGASA
jgi:aspartyl-tRNA(Asn)/glutamyl-tRNA(Gln) amidotransferase subunit A